MRQTLEILARKLGFDISYYINGESPKRISINIDIESVLVAGLADNDYQELIEVFGQGLSLEIGQPGLLPLLQISRGDVDKLETSINMLRTFAKPGTTFRLDLDIQKFQLLAKIDDPAIEFNAVLYIFREALIRFFSSSFEELENHLFSVDQMTSIVVIADGSECLVGPILTVISRPMLDSRKSHTADFRLSTRKRVQECRELATQNLSWIGFRFRHLTPIHFVISESAPTDDAIANLLAERLFQLSILFSANRSILDQDSFTAHFASADQTSTIAFAIRGRSLQANGMLDRHYLTRYALWTQKSETVDRLNITQSVVARQLAGVDKNESYRYLGANLPQIFEEARFQYRQFIDKAIDSHFQQVDTFAAYLNELVKQISDSIDSITKGLTESLLAAIGVVIVGFLTAVVEQKVQGAVFEVAMKAYATYLIIGQVFLRMGSIYHSYRLLKQESEQRIRAFERELGQKRTAPLVEPLKKRDFQFFFWFWLAIAVYVFVAIYVWNMSAVILAQLGVITAAP